MPCGFDCGTYTLVCCARDEKGEFSYNKEINAFIEIPLTDRFVFNMMKNSGVPLLERPKIAYALGNAAIKMAYTMPQIELKRPMKDGCVNPKEKEAFELLKVMIHSLLEGSVKKDKDILYYSIPANAINEETDANYHSQVLESIISAYESDNGFKVKPLPINEGLALIYAELKDKNYTGLAMSFGSGMVNVCFAIYGVSVFQFSLVNSGDYLDKKAAKSCGESPNYINQEKLKVDLIKPIDNLVHKAIQIQYKLLVEKVINDIKKSLLNSDKKARLDKPIDVIIAGGTSMAKGFDILFKQIITDAELPIQLGSIIHPEDALFTVSKGCLLSAEASLT